MSTALKPLQFAIALLFLCLMAGSTPAAEPVAVADSTTRPDFSGQWHINPALSDDIEPKLRELKAIAYFKRERKKHSEKSEKREEGKTSSRGYNRQRIERNMKYIPGDMDFLIDDVRNHFRYMRALRIRHSDPVLRLRSDDGRSRRIYSDGRGAKIRALGDSSQVVSFAGWEGNEIVVESHVTEQLHLVERLSLKSGIDQLSLLSTYSSPGSENKVEIRLIFDRQDAATR